MSEKEKPKLRNDATFGFRFALGEALTKTLFKDEIFPFQTCITCSHFDETNELCRLYKLRPPARIIAFGCKSYADQDEIPF